jgi:hypothetical protein
VNFCGCPLRFGDLARPSLGQTDSNPSSLVPTDAPCVHEWSSPRFVGDPEVEASRLLRTSVDVRLKAGSTLSAPALKPLKISSFSLP